jgi:hypothetical protein
VALGLDTRTTPTTVPHSLHPEFGIMAGHRAGDIIGFLKDGFAQALSAALKPLTPSGF